MKKCFALALCLIMLAATPVWADVLSDLEKAESIFGMDNSDKTAIERVSYLEEQLGISDSGGSLAERINAIEGELGITNEAETESILKAETEAPVSVEEALAMAPSDDFVIERLKYIGTITDIAPVTEDHDPNGQLGKQGGYIGCIYFADSQVDRSQIYSEGDNVIDIGTEGGGAIEIYKTAAEAATRESYLASFDGTIFSTGSHCIIGTCVVRTSARLTASQQNSLTEEIIHVLTAESTADL